ncbi:acyltransferase [Rhodoblastus sp.]|jgi:peptidoglycan/LPS O-acetylase OafA/YrhL|uniref:acyltransferase family protein n=1 Tax=Rhodoblastus sp. TaxID=1962975 RepID=UPI0025F9CE6E|nr:acyltransferase [Rhodoblastus sp.]
MPYPVVGICIGALLAFATAMGLAELLARRGFPLPSGGKRIGQIDGLRGFLSLSVMVHHFVIWLQITRLGGSWAPPSINFFQMLGTGAVALFFMTTGLLFYPRIRAGFRANSWPALYISRVFRLIPMSVAAFVFVTLVVMLQTGRGLDADFPRAALQWITAADMPPLLGYDESARVNAAVLWSLKYEWQFYLAALPICALLMDLFRPRLPSWALPVAVILIGVMGRKLFPDVGLWKYIPLFGTGMLAFEAQSRPEIVRRLQSRAVTLAALLALLFAMTLFKSPLDLAWPLLSLFFFAVACGNDMFGLLRTRAALVLGECCYGIYLTHGILLFLLFTHGGALTGLFATPFLPLLMPLVALVLALLTAGTYLLVERPGMKAGRILSDRWRTFAGRKISFAAK